MPVLHYATMRNAYTYVEDAIFINKSQSSQTFEKIV